VIGRFVTDVQFYFQQLLRHFRVDLEPLKVGLTLVLLPNRIVVPPVRDEIRNKLQRIQAAD
jgi:hypothetical protein